jgi:hypothetical protein
VCVRAMDMELKVKRKVQVCLEVRAGVSALSVVSWKLWWSAQNMRKRCPLTPVLIETSVSGAHRRLFSGRDASPGACTERIESYLLVWSVYRVYARREIHSLHSGVQCIGNRRARQVLSGRKRVTVHRRGPGRQCAP